MKPFRNHLYAATWVFKVLYPALVARGRADLTEELNGIMMPTAASTGTEACLMTCGGLGEFLEQHAAALSPVERQRIANARDVYGRVPSVRRPDYSPPPDDFNWDDE